MTVMRKPVQRTAEKISIKGTKDGLVVTIGEGEWPELINELTSHLQHEAAFFSGARTILDTGPRELATEHLRQLKGLFSANRMEILGIRTTAQRTAEAAAALGIPTKAERGHAVGSVPESNPDQEAEKALFIKRTIRSGQMVQYPGHITIIGDVNPGAQVVAGGDIIVWGRLKGTAHAGARGDDSAIVCALFLAPTQLRIGNHIARSPEGEDRNLPIPEIARVDDKEIVVEAWTVGKQ